MIVLRPLQKTLGVGQRELRSELTLWEKEKTKKKEKKKKRKEKREREKKIYIYQRQFQSHDHLKDRIGKAAK